MNPDPPRSRPARWWTVPLALAVGAAVWLPAVHLCFVRPDSYFQQSDAVPPHARELAERHLELWTTPALKQRELDRMRDRNAEWDFMGRSFFVWSLAEMCLRDPAGSSRYLAVADGIIDETLRLEAERGQTVFLLPYGQPRFYVQQPARSLFVDGEIALMLATRCVVSDHPDYRRLLRERVDTMMARWSANPSMLLESYPNECWLFDHAIALAAVRLSDHLNGTDHSAFLRAWTDKAKADYTDPATGLLVSSYGLHGEHFDGPEGSTIWASLHFLRLIDADFAREQYTLARRHIASGLGGFGWSREWPVAWRGEHDVDSGMVVPGLEVSAGGSGLAFTGASSFGDTDYLRRLHRTLAYAAFPLREDGKLRYCASNLVGDATLLYAGVLGPIWNRVEGVSP